MQLRMTSSPTPEFAYIVTSFDEHQQHQFYDIVGRLEVISGFQGTGDIVITLKSAALWTEPIFLEMADEELDCDWKIFVKGDEPTIAMWLAV